MSEARLLSLLERNSHAAALARATRDGQLLPRLRRMEAEGLVWRRGSIYRLTRIGRDELDATRLLTRLVLASGSAR